MLAQVVRAVERMKGVEVGVDVGEEARDDRELIQLRSKQLINAICQVHISLPSEAPLLLEARGLSCMVCYLFWAWVQKCHPGKGKRSDKENRS